jgi:hypothetical protein
MVTFAQVNWLAVVVGVVFANALGFAWYGPLFAKQWLQFIGKKQEQLQPNPTMYLVSVVGSVITMIVLALLVAGLGGGTLVQGAVAGSVIWIGTGGVAGYVSNLFEGRPRGLWLINTGYNLVTYVVMGAVFTIWR